MKETPTPEATTEVTPEPTTQPTATPVPSTQTGECPGLTGEQTYVVQRGDNLFRIALRYDTSISAIMTRNGITDPTVLSVGQQLVIPNPCSGYVGLPGSNNSRWWYNTRCGGTTTSACVPTLHCKVISMMSSSTSTGTDI